MKNIILIITDTFRYDNLYDRNREMPVNTPNLDRFADERATEINGFLCGSFPTIPQRTDVLTSFTGWPHYGWKTLDFESSEVMTLHFEKRGYATQLICDCPHLFKNGFLNVFHAAYQHRGQEGDKHLLHLNDEIKTIMPLEKTRMSPIYRGHSLPDMHRWTNRYYNCEEDAFSSKTAATTVRWLEENYQAGPFLLWVDFFDPHEPWDPPEYLVRKYDPDYKGAPMIHPYYGSSSAYTPAELKNLKAHYSAESELVDRAIGKVIQKLDDLQLWDDTIVVVTADHGMSLGEHGRTGKSMADKNQDHPYWPMYPEISKVPFLIAGGDIPKGKKINMTALPVDIFPTFCELAEGVPLETEKTVNGISFAPALKGEVFESRKIAVTSRNYNLWDKEMKDAPFAVAGEWGYAPVGMDGSRELFYLTEDPLAEKNIFVDNMEKADEIHKMFIEYIKSLGASNEMLAFWENVK